MLRTIGGLFFRWLTKLVLTAIACGFVFFAVVAVIDPWALHIGGRWTPFTWIGAGKLATKSGAEYPLFVLFYLDNPAKARGSLEPSSPVQGMAPHSARRGPGPSGGWRPGWQLDPQHRRARHGAESAGAARES